MMPSTATRTRYAADTDGMVCLLLDIRGQARPNSLQVFSYSLGKIVDLPTGAYKNGPRRGRKIIRNETPDAKRWAAVSVPRWLAQAEGLYGRPQLPPIISGFCREFTPDTRSDQEKRDDGERELAQYIVDRENRYRRLPGQRLQFGKSDIRNGAISA
jgi:hypothetical protein